ncbi:MAG: class I SAM-dependent DNA methyltransferase [Candidatus Thorarchaeota archaeon]
MTKNEFLTEDNVLSILIRAVDEIESHIKRVHYKEFDRTLGFFFARVLDNKITRSVKSKKEYELAIIRAAAFILVTQIFIYIIQMKESDIKRLEFLPFQNNKDLQLLFDEMASNQNYDPIFNTRVVELLPAESISSINQIFKNFLPFHKIQHSTDILGKIFHGMIPFDLRKFLAAYYTSNVAGEFLSYLAIKNDQVTVMDPACGSGTLLVSAYKRIQELNETLEHHQILQKLYGVDVSSFAALLATVNLAIQEPANTWYKNNISIIDFFRIRTNIPELRKFDIIIGNPPFTRGDRLDSDYKDFLESFLRYEGITFNYNKKYLGFYAYFLLGSLNFLKTNGILAYVLPLSFINSLNMKPILNFILSKFSFRYIITSEAQNVFSEQCTFKEILFIAQKNQARRAVTKFAVIKTELKRENFKHLAKIIENTTKAYEDSNIRINLLPQKFLEKNVNINWVVFLFNQQFFSIFNQIRNLDTISQVNELVKTPRYDVDRGLRAGISNFFYLPNKFWKIIENSKSHITIENIETDSVLEIPSRYISSVLRKSSRFRCIVPEVLDYIVVIPESDALEEAIKDYIAWGVQKFQKSGFENLAYKHMEKGRKIARIAITHELSLETSKIITFYSPTPIILSDNFIFIRTYKEHLDKIIAAYLNSSIFLLTYFVLRREKTGALGQIFGTDMRNFFCLNPKKVTKTDQKELFRIFDQFILESSDFDTFYYQIQDAKKNENHIRFLLDKKICEILKVPNVPSFINQVYEVLSEELKKFH